MMLCTVYRSELMLALVFFFFFKQKTAYEMRISDWSSDVCSSDLRVALRAAAEHRKQDADAEVEAVHHDIGEDGEGDDAGPYGRQVEIAHVYCPDRKSVV